MSRKTFARSMVVTICLLFSASGVTFAAGIPGTEKVIARGAPGTNHISSADVAALGAQRIRDYDTYTLLRIPSGSHAALATISTRTGIQFEMVPDWDAIVLPKIKIDTRAATPGGSVKRYPTGTGLYLIQFNGALVPEWESALTAAGLRHIGYIPYNAALVVGSEAAVATIQANPNVQWVSLYQPAYRAQPERILPGTAEMIVQFANVPESAEHIAAFEKQHNIRQIVKYLSYKNLRLRISSPEAMALLNDPFVIGLEYVGNEQLSGEREAISLTTPTPSTTSVYQLITAGSWQPFRPSPTYSYRDWVPAGVRTAAANYRIAFADSGLDNGPCGAHHPDLNDYSTMIFVDYVTTGGCAQDSVGHGTMVTGFAVANPPDAPSDARMSPAQSFNYGMGVSPTTTIMVQKIWDGYGLATTNGGELTWANDALNSGSTVQTHSHNTYGAVGPGAGVYGLEAQQYDAAIQDTFGRQIPITTSAGNICGGADNYANGDCSTMVLTPATAKNVISVGAAESYRPGVSACNASTGTVRQPGDFYADSFDNVAYISRRGTADSRIKPDILAPATQASSTHSQNTFYHFCNTDSTRMYDYDTGTSFAAPQVAAAAVLIDAKRGATFSPALLKATLIGTAHSMMGGTDRYNSLNGFFPGTVGARPNSTQGFGRVYLSDFMWDNLSYHLFDQTAFTPFTSAGESRTASLTVTDTSKPVVLVLAWTDEPANVPAGITLVRDLDLEAWGPNSCVRFTGNFMGTNEVSIAQNICGSVTRTYDRRNNIEMIVFPPGNTTWTFSVSVNTWGYGSHNQPFAVFASNVN